MVVVDRIVTPIELTVTDLFCGAGGVSEGIERARYEGRKIGRVIQAVNHSPLAIENHANNFRDTIHYEEDITLMDEKKLKFTHVLWASIECTNFSIAKGGQSRDADSRTLATHLYRYIDHIKPWYIVVENVREFMLWGRLRIKSGVCDESSCELLIDRHNPDRYVFIPYKEYNGEYFNAWIENIEKRGYTYTYKILDSADYGAKTTRKRYFGVFYKKGFPFQFPEQTHAQKGEKGLQKWNAVRDCIDLHDEGNSIFTRKKPLVPATIRRIEHGLKYVLENDEDVSFIMKYYGKGKNVSELNNPIGTITTKDRMALVTVKKHFTTKHMHGCLNSKGIDEPIGAILTRDERMLVTIELDKENFISYQFGKGFSKSIDNPLAAITTVPKGMLVTVLKDTGIIKDIKTRFLHPHELQRAMGMNIELKGSRREKCWLIGNAVTPIIPQKKIETIYEKIVSLNN